MDDLKRHVATRLRAARRKKRLTQEAVAEAAGVTTETVSNSERAQSLVTLDVFLRLARVLELDVHDFMDDVPQRKKVSTKRMRLEGDLASIAEEMSDVELTLLVQIGRLLCQTAPKG